MAYMVPFDGSDQAVTALERAVTYGEAMDLDVVAVTVIPEGHDYAVERGWIDDSDPFDPEAIRRYLRALIDDVDPDVELHVKRVGQYLSHGGVAKRLRKAAREMDAAVVFLGSENAGRVVQPITSIGGAVAADQHYDVFLVRQTA